MLYVFPFMLEGIEMTGSFIVFLVVTILCLIFSYFFVKETKGLNHREIDKIYDKEWNCIIKFYLLYNNSLYCYGIKIVAN